MPFQVRVQAGPLTSDDIKVELYAGRLNADGEIVEPVITEMLPVNRDKDGIVYEAKVIPCCASGQFGSTVRILPRHPDLKKFVPGLILWANQFQTAQAATRSAG